jgi:hypothetical protein
MRSFFAKLGPPRTAKSVLACGPAATRINQTCAVLGRQISGNPTTKENGLRGLNFPQAAF